MIVVVNVIWHSLVPPTAEVIQKMSNSNKVVELFLSDYAWKLLDFETKHMFDTMSETQ